VKPDAGSASIIDGGSVIIDESRQELLRQLSGDVVIPGVRRGVLGRQGIGERYGHFRVRAVDLYLCASAPLRDAAERVHLIYGQLQVLDFLQVESCSSGNDSCGKTSERNVVTVVRYSEMDPIRLLLGNGLARHDDEPA